MYVNSSLSLNHLPLFGGGAAAPSSKLTWGAESLDVFNRPIGSAGVIDLQSDRPLAGKPVDSWGSWGSSKSGTGSEYFEWFHATVAFRKAANEGRGESANPEPAASTGDQDESGAAATNQATESNSGAGQNAAEPDAPAGGADTGDTASNSGDSGLLGFLFGGS